MKFLSTITDKTLRFFLLFSVAAALIFIPLRILSFGWAPNYGMLLSSTITKTFGLPISDEVLTESIKNNVPIYVKEKEDNLFYIVTISFILFNIVGFCNTQSSISWLAAMSVLMISNSKFILRILSCSPQVLIIMLLMTLIVLFNSSLKENPKASSFAILVYIFFIRSIVPPEIYALDIININYKYLWNQPFQDFFPLLAENSWMFFVVILMWIDARKTKTKFVAQLDNPLIFVALIIQLFINLGYNDLALFRDALLLLWFSFKFSEIFKLASCFKELRVKYCIGIYIVLLFVLLASNDCLGRYSKHPIDNAPIDFSLKGLEDWKPDDGCTLYNDRADFAFVQYYNYPDADYSYINLNSFSLFEKEKENIINIKKELENNKKPLPDCYEYWVEQMTSGDRLVTSVKINGLDNIEWLQCGQKLWLGRLKNNLE